MSRSRNHYIFLFFRWKTFHLWLHSKHIGFTILADIFLSITRLLRNDWSNSPSEWEGYDHVVSWLFTEQEISWLETYLSCSTNVPTIYHTYHSPYRQGNTKNSLMIATKIKNIWDQFMNTSYLLHQNRLIPQRSRNINRFRRF